MASISFSNLVTDPNSTYPSSLVDSLTSNGVVLDNISTGVKGIAFNANGVTLTGTYESLSASNTTTTFRIDRAYNGQTFAIINTDNSSSLFTVATGTANQTLTNNGFDTVTPITRRVAGGLAG